MVSNQERENVYNYEKTVLWTSIFRYKWYPHNWVNILIFVWLISIIEIKDQTIMFRNKLKKTNIKITLTIKLISNILQTYK